MVHTTADGDRIVMDAETAEYLLSPRHLVETLDRMEQKELAAWLSRSLPDSLPDSQPSTINPQPPHVPAPKLAA